MELIISSTPQLNAIALTMLRIGIGILFIGHGFLKIKRGIPELVWTGEQMRNLGITFVPLFWGICAMLSEFLGGICLTLGLGTRIAACFMSFTMLVAIIHHIAKGDSYGYISFPLSQLIIFISLVIAGSGIFSLDNYFFLT
ncbi:MAG: DoxX family protein [Candidatus Babeliales bacterium]